MRKRWASLILVFILVFSFTAVGFADTIGEKKGELKETKENIHEIKDQIGDVKDKQEDVLGDINSIQAQVDKIQDEIFNMKKQMETTKKNIKKTNKELEKAVKDFNEQKNLYEERVKAMYINGPSGYLELILSSDGFSDFFTRMDMVKRVVEFDKNILKEMMDKQEAINKKKVQLQGEEKKLVSLQRGLLAKKADMDKANASKKQYYNKLEGDINALEKALDEEIDESRRIADQIKRLSSTTSSGGSYSGSKTGILRVSDIGHMPRITSPFGMRWHPTLNKYKMHTGIDIGIPTGTPVYAMASGRVIISQYGGSYGNYVVIDHGGGIATLYAHNSQRLVSVGQTVEKGQMITKSGSTGRSTGPHLHFEVRKNGTPIDPMPYYIVGQ